MEKFQLPAIEDDQMVLLADLLRARSRWVSDGTPASDELIAARHAQIDDLKAALGVDNELAFLRANP